MACLDVHPNDRALTSSPEPAAVDSGIQNCPGLFARIEIKELLKQFLVFPIPYGRKICLLNDYEEAGENAAPAILLRDPVCNDSQHGGTCCTVDIGGVRLNG
jgi:hypothetical protein